MKREINELLKEVIKYSLILLAVGILITLVITKTSFDILIIYIVGWVTALLNLFLLAYFINLLGGKNGILLGFPIFLFRYVIYGISMYLCVKGQTSGIYWAAGVITMVIALMIGGITSQNRKEENNEC